jgi:ubiquinone/menaquinone biosynthesis C-methylase UbiE
MEINYKKVIEPVNTGVSDEIPENYKYYWGYQYKLGEQAIVPYIQKAGAFKPGCSVMEIGSAEGGVLHTFVEAGAGEAVGTDIAQNRLDMGKKISRIMDMDVSYEYHNIITEEIPEKWNKHFDLVLLRDVIEHLDDTYIALSKISRIIKPGGFLFVTFPPYHSPFGGHQHTIDSTAGKLPYIHLLPDFIFHKLLSKGREGDIGEVKRLQQIKLTTKKFESALEKTSLEIYKKDFYLLRPVFKMKFGLPAIKLTGISFIPGIKKFFSLEASYLLRQKN